MSTTAHTDATAIVPSKDRRRVAVLNERGHTGAAALDVARELDLQHGATVTVVAVAPSAPAATRLRETTEAEVRVVSPQWT